MVYLYSLGHFCKCLTRLEIQSKGKAHEGFYFVHWSSCQWRRHFTFCGLSNVAFHERGKERTCFVLSLKKTSHSKGCGEGCEGVRPNALPTTSAASTEPRARGGCPVNFGWVGSAQVRVGALGRSAAGTHSSASLQSTTNRPHAAGDASLADRACCGHTSELREDTGFRVKCLTA